MISALSHLFVYIAHTCDPCLLVKEFLLSPEDTIYYGDKNVIGVSSAGQYLNNTNSLHRDWELFQNLRRYIDKGKGGFWGMGGEGDGQAN